ncbi:hypothetical protein LXL04_016823 [Taraxacum kok-saghyz]
MATLPPQIGRRRTPPCVKKTRNRPAPLKGSSFPTLLLLLHTVVAVDLSSHLAAAAISPSPLVPYLLLVRNFSRFASRFRTGLLPLFISILLDYIIAILIRSLNHLFISIPISISILICYLNHTAAEGRGILPISVSRNLLNLLSLYAQNIRVPRDLYDTQRPSNLSIQTEIRSSYLFVQVVLSDLPLGSWGSGSQFRHFNPFHVYSAMGQPLRLEIKTMTKSFEVTELPALQKSVAYLQKSAALGLMRHRLKQHVVLPVIAGVSLKHRIQSNHFTSPLAFKPIGCETERKIRGTEGAHLLQRRAHLLQRRAPLLDEQIFLSSELHPSSNFSPEEASSFPSRSDPKLLLPCDRTPTANPPSVCFLLHQQRAFFPFQYAISDLRLSGSPTRPQCKNPRSLLHLAHPRTKKSGFSVNLLLSKWMRELEKEFYGNIVAFYRAMLPEAKQDDVQIKKQDKY